MLFIKFIVFPLPKGQFLMVNFLQFLYHILPYLNIIVSMSMNFTNSTIILVDLNERKLSLCILIYQVSPESRSYESLQ